MGQLIVTVINGGLIFGALILLFNLLLTNTNTNERTSVEKANPKLIQNHKTFSQ